MAAQRKLRVAVLFGGRSAEHEISILSARFIVESLDREKFEPVLIGIDKSGRWHLQEEALLLGAARDPRLVKLNQATPDVALAAHPSASGEASLAIQGAGDAAID
ncbi:MAG TPA: D-alanine--D-alanine ligase A, partial [Polyangiaceae bacterium]|nr:D-alanine--D-alanine ligase A [Polyangiaceae bacterium]